MFASYASKLPSPSDILKDNFLRAPVSIIIMANAFGARWDSKMTVHL